MKITAAKVILFIGLIIAIFGIGFIVMLVYAAKKDISDDPRFSQHIGTPIEVKSVSTLRWNKTNLRFKNYDLNANDDTEVYLDDVKTVKTYQIGTSIQFYAAKSYKSIHVGETYYLLGRDTLSSGEIIEFEYYTGSNYSPEIWETDEDFLERVEKKTVD